MGTNLTPIIPRTKIGLKGIKGKVFAVDALNVIYQFLSLIRLPDGEFFRDSKGNITSHLIGISSRFTRLMLDYGCRFIFVFDGPPHPLKKAELEKRRKIREKAEREWKEALKRGDLEAAFSKAVVAVSVNEQIINDAKRLLDLMGVPVIDAPHDAEAQAAYMVNRGDAWALNTLDWDALLYGSKRMVRYITLTGSEWLPSKKMARRLEPELIELSQVLGYLNITREQLIDVAILVGTDYNEGVRGIGPKKALRLIKTYGSLERLPVHIREKLPENWKDIREIFLHPPVKEDYSLSFKQPDLDGLYHFLVNERDFSPKRVRSIVERLSKIKPSYSQFTLEFFFGGGHDL